MWKAITAGSADEERQWISDLKERGISAAHPENGYVDQNTLWYGFGWSGDFYFNDGLESGSLLEIGCPTRSKTVKVISVKVERLVSTIPGKVIVTYEDT